MEEHKTDNTESKQCPKIKVVIVKPCEIPCVEMIDRNLESMQSVVGGLIEQVCPFDDDVSLICNEEGKLEGLTPNRVLRDEDGEIYDFIAGTFFIAYTPPDSEQFESLPDELCEKYKEVFKYPEFIFMSNRKIKVFRIDYDDFSDVS